METKKLVLIIILSTSLLFLWEAWQRETQPPASQVTPGTVAESNDQRHGPLPVPGDELASSQSEASGIAAEIEGASASITPNLLTMGEKIHVTTDMVVAEIDTAGGDLRRLGLRKHPSREDKDTPYALLLDQAARFNVAQSGLIGDGLPSHKTQFTLDSATTDYELKPGEDKVVVRLLAPEVNGLQIAKIYTFHRDSYVIDVEFEITNHSESSIQPFSYFQMLRDSNAPDGAAFMVHSYTGPAIYTDAEKFQKIDFSDIDKNKAEYPTNADDGWIAMLEHYFLAAWLPKQGTPREYYAKRLAPNQYAAGIIVPVGAIAPGQTKNITLPLYAGPQEQDKLAQLSPGLDLTVDYGWLTVIAKPLFWLLSFYHSWVGNWGFAIILLTLTVKLLFFPLSAAGYRSMAKLRVVTPKLQRIREQYSGDRQRMHQAMMEFYKEEKINPMGGCLPILVQIPVFIALFWTLLAAVELRYAPFVLWITDMSVPDPYYVLPLIMGVSMWVQSKLSPKPADPIQAKVMQIMPVAFSVFFFFFPSGLVLYSLVNNILSIAQQWQITRMFENKAEAEANKEKSRGKSKGKVSLEKPQLQAPTDEKADGTEAVQTADSTDMSTGESTPPALNKEATKSKRRNKRSRRK
ncbi:protein translocase subunit yidC [Nitrosomonas cryotolerans]|uniref:Membrane protein insertase YidC n=1 Tax=Nitrosomonas cryotolerans ATCC 49181 TaxID=1131553 RepID=A0A1N6GWI3_9PROT|nr:membrane protein insertase YidC [Nitrosomonas cryotolerans]SFP41893.1 protein translocase subunit yidC [Nitrosomonas cryotolerans]SIO11876.1 protein translocase subunit yidC [Nitrosomonas cryotolerans ATCC 49181]